MENVTKKGPESCAVGWLCSCCSHLCDDWWTRTRTETPGLRDPSQALSCADCVKIFQSLTTAQRWRECRSWSSGAWQWVCLFPPPPPRSQAAHLYHCFTLISAVSPLMGQEGHGGVVRVDQRPSEEILTPGKGLHYLWLVPPQANSSLPPCLGGYELFFFF